MGNTPIARRAKRERDAHTRPQLRAEHGVSMLVTTYCGGNKDSFLFDTGVTIDGVLHNMDVLEVKGNELHAVVLEPRSYGSHARVDWDSSSATAGPDTDRAPSRRVSKT